MSSLDECQASATGQTSPNITQCLFGGKKKRSVNKFYQQQCNLLENYENDSKQIQNFQQKRNLQNQSSLDEEPTSSLLHNDFAEKPSNIIEINDNAAAVATEHLITRNTHQAPLAPKVTFLSDRSECSTKVLVSAKNLAFITLSVNLMLTLAKGVASYLSGSLSIISSLVDSLVDITSGLVIWLTSRAIRKHDPYLYPVGRTRLEPVALVIVSVIMAVASVQMVVQSLESIVNKRIDPHVDIATLSIMVVTVITKLILFALCAKVNDPSVKVLAQDHRNDCLSNTIALICAFCAQKFWIYLDPIGAILVAVYIAVTWFRTGREQLMMLSGRSARPEFINRIIKVCIDHDERINYIDTVHVYHFGTRFLVEVHIVLDEDMRLKEAHDISETLQNNIESLEEVERAFVHVDYEYDHRPQDEHKLPYLVTSLVSIKDQQDGIPPPFCSVSM